MGFLSTLAGIASGAGSIGAIGSAIGGVAGLLGFGHNDQKQQLKSQKELMAYQNQLNQQNALLDYERQRQLTQDSPSLFKTGLKQAGINSAFINGGSQVGAASHVNPISPASPPSPLPTQSQVDSQYSSMINDSASVLSNLALQRSQIGLIQEQAENQRQRNLTQVQRDIAELRQRAAEARSVELRNQYERQLKEAESRYYEMNAKNKAWILENDSVMADLQSYYYGDMKVAELENLRADYLNKSEDANLKKTERQFYKYRARLIESQILANKSSAADSLSHVGVNRTTTRLNTANAHFIEKGMDDNLAILKSERVRKWYDALPQNVQQIILSSDAVRSAVGKLQNGGDLDTSDWTALGAALGYEKAGALVEVIKNAIGTRKVTTVKHVSSK